MTEPLTIQVNGVERSTDARTLAELLDGMGFGEGTRGVAVALNERVVSARSWSATPLSPHDRIEIVRPLAGG